MTVSLQDWKKNKAKTLLTEPLSAALKEYDAALAKLVNPQSASGAKALESMSAYLGANKSVQVAIAKTQKLCLPGVHGDTKKYLAKIDTETKNLYKGVQQLQRAYNEQLQIFQARKTEAIAAIEPVLRDSTPPAVHKAIEKTQALLDAMNAAQKKGLTSEEMTSHLRAMASILPAFAEILKMNEEANKTNPGRPLPLNPGQLKGPLGDISNALKRLKSIGGFPAPKMAKGVFHGAITLD
jgi:dsDNA-binding SOS-regulon protein